MKKFFKKIAAWWAAHKPTKRRLIQLYAFLLTNANIKGFFSGNIYTGNSKYMCVPGLNCYSCPGAVGACPLGALQNALAASDTRAPYYVIGIIVLFGLMLGRTICGFLCPFGLGQDLVYKIKTPKLKKNRITRVLSYLKYVILLVFVIALPLAYSGKLPVPTFCKYICPAGTIGGALALLINPGNESYLSMLGPLFTWKFSVMVVIVVACIFIYRAFCRFVCPLGALYGFFNKIALIGVRLDKNKCTDCGLCIAHCKMDVRRVGDHECINCGECMSVCPTKAIRWKGSQLFVHENTTEPFHAPVAEAKPLGAFLNASSQTSTVTAQPSVIENQPKQKKGKRWWLQFTAWALASVLLVTSLVYYNVIVSDTAAQDSVIMEVGDEYYDFSFSVYCRGEGETVTIKELSAQGKVVVLNYWFVGCTPCEAELPEFEAFAKDYSESVAVVAIHRLLITDDVAAFLQKKTYEDGTSWSDGEIIFSHDTEMTVEENGQPATYSSYALSGGNGAYPMTLILNTDGVIVYQKIGGTNYETLERVVTPLLIK